MKQESYHRHNKMQYHQQQQQLPAHMQYLNSMPPPPPPQPPPYAFVKEPSEVEEEVDSPNYACSPPREFGRVRLQHVRGEAEEQWRRRNMEEAGGFVKIEIDGFNPQSPIYTCSPPREFGRVLLSHVAKREVEEKWRRLKEAGGFIKTEVDEFFPQSVIFTCPSPRVCGRLRASHVIAREVNEKRWRKMEMEENMRNLRIREDPTKYLLNLDDPKTTSMREDPLPHADPSEKFYMGASGQASEFKQLNTHSFEKGQDIHIQ